MSSATFGTANEDNAHLSRNESKAVRRRSLTLLGSLIRPVRARFWLTAASRCPSYGWLEHGRLWHVRRTPRLLPGL